VRPDERRSRYWKPDEPAEKPERGFGFLLLASVVVAAVCGLILAAFIAFFVVCSSVMQPRRHPEKPPEPAEGGP
jgi:hypothetical protein